MTWLDALDRGIHKIRHKNWTEGYIIIEEVKGELFYRAFDDDGKVCEIVQDYRQFADRDEWVAHDLFGGI